MVVWNARYSPGACWRLVVSAEDLDSTRDQVALFCFRYGVVFWQGATENRSQWYGAIAVDKELNVNRVSLCCVAICLLVMQALPCSAQQETPAKSKPPATQQAAKPKKPRVNPVLAPIEDVEGLPRVLLIGDSISMGYTLPVRELLKGKANVHRPPTNCGPTTRGVEQLDQWLSVGGKEKTWDVIHFNWGLHDLKYMGANGSNLADPEAEGSHQQVPPDEYRKNLEVLVKRLKKTGAKLIWRNTTPVPEGAKGRVVGDSLHYNEIAAQVMKQEGVPIHDLYEYAKEHAAKIQRKADVHYTPAGSRQLAEQVVKAIEEALGDKQ